MENQVQTTNNATLPSYDLAGELPQLADAKVLPADLTSEYWTPENAGDFKLCFFQEIKSSTYVDEASGEEIELPCAILLSQDKNGDIKTLRNGSKRLVASLQDALDSHKISAGTPLRIEFLGKQKNSTNAFKSDRWSVKPLIVQ